MPAGRKPKPAEQRRNRHALKYEEQVAPGAGWQHGPVPKPPAGLLKASRDAWGAWFDAWFAAFWSPADVPVLELVVRLFDAAERTGDTKHIAEFRLWADRYGLTPKGRQDLRWQPPRDEAPGRPHPSEVRVLRVLDPQDRKGTPA